MSKKDDKKNRSQQPAEPAAEKPQAADKAPAPDGADKAQPAAETQPDAAQEPQAPQPTEADTLKASLAEANDKYLRMLAEYDNYRRRSAKERENIYADVRADTVKKFLPVYDNLVRAAQHETDDETKKGVEGILTQFKAILEGLGVTPIETVGKKFDANLHDALLHIEDEKYGEGEIVLELETGFKLGDKVIRFAKVQVAN